jgi:tetratricopeptide (TPR) repeat protein
MLRFRLILGAVLLGTCPWAVAAAQDATSSSAAQSTSGEAVPDGISSPAGLDPELDQPYRLQVVLHLSDHRALTVPFCDKLQRDLHDSLQAALGKLARVEVLSVRQKDLEARMPQPNPALAARLREIEAAGLQRALDGWNFITGTKLHFVFIDYVDGRYEIQSRQYDGLAGLASPVVRTPPGPITDRQLVARSAALLVSEDFGVVGTVGSRQGDKVDVAIKGDAVPGASLSGWLRRGDVFAVTQLVMTRGSQRTSQRSDRQDWTMLVVQDEPQNGICKCQLYHRYENPLQPRAGALGYRCLKLYTLRAPLQLRLIAKDTPGTPLSGLSVQVRGQGSEGNGERLSTNSDGLVRTTRAYDNAAFVRVSDGTQVLAQLPVQLVSDRVITVAVEPKRGGDQRGQLEMHRRRWQRHIYDAVEIATAVARDFNALTARDKALAKLQEGIKILEAELTNLKAERANLSQEATALKVSLDLSQEEESLKELEGTGAKWRKHMDALAQTLQQESSPQRRKWAEMAEQARSLQDAYEFDKAIALYEKIIAEGSDDKSVEDQLKKLKDAWDTKNSELRQARVFIYETLPKVETAADMKAKLKQTQEAFDACQQAGDRLTPRMLLKVIVNITAKLAKELEPLRPQESDDDRRTAETIKSVSDDLRKLSEEVTGFLKGKKQAA